MATTIKVDRVVLLDTLTAKLAEQDKFRADYDKAEEKYKKEQVAYADKIIALAKSGKLEVHRTNVRTWNGIVEIEFKVDKAIINADPERPDKPTGMLHDSDYEELRKTVRLLGMTNEPFVPASTYKSVSQWL